MKIILKDKNNIVNISDSIFNIKFNEQLIHQVIVSLKSKSRSGTHSQKNRSEVSGSGKKPWRQKGTGRARSGSIRSPIWRSGGVTFAAKPASYNKKINKKMYKGAMRSIISELLRQKRLVVFSNFSIEKPKTSILSNKLKELGFKNALIVVDKPDTNLFLAARNIYRVKIQNVKYINPINLITYNEVIMTINSIRIIEETLK